MAQPGVPTASLNDLIAVTLENLKKGSWRNLQKYRSYTVDKLLSRPDKGEGPGGGYRISRKVSTISSTSAAHVLPYESRAINVQETMRTITMPVVTATDYWVIEDTEVSANTPPAQIVDLIKVRKGKKVEGLLNELEERFWQAGVATNPRYPFGVPHWIVKATAANAGYTTNLPSGFADVGGIIPGDATADPSSRWANWGATGAGYYTGEVNETCLQSWRMAFLMSRFQSPEHMADLADADKPVSQMRHYTTAQAYTEMQKIQKMQNDNVGADLARYEGKLVFQGVPIEEVPYLTATATGDPIYGINFGAFKIWVDPKMHFADKGPFTDGAQPLVHITHTFLLYSLYCDDRRANFVLAKS